MSPLLEANAVDSRILREYVKEGDIVVNVKLANPFIEAFMSVMPVLGCPTPKRTKVYLHDKEVSNEGVSVRVNFKKELVGSVVYNMTEDSAKFIASSMMMGMPVSEMDELASSAIKELSNMLTANATTNLAKLGFLADISTPNLVMNKGETMTVGSSQCLGVEMDVGGHSVNILIAIKRAKPGQAAAGQLID